MYFCNKPSRAPACRFWALFLLSFVYLLGALNYPIDYYDEGVPVYGALRVLGGDLPYRDFWTMYAPLQFYVLAFLFKCFGAQLLVARVWDCAIRALLCCMILRLGSRVLARRSSWMAWLLSLLWLERCGHFSYAMFPALLFSFLCFHFFFESEAARKPKPNTYALLSGMALGVTGLFRHDVGAYAGLALLSSILISARFLTVTAPSAGGENVQLSPSKLVRLLALGAVLVVSGPALFFLAQVPIADLRDCLFDFPFKVFPHVRAVPFPTLLETLRPEAAEGLRAIPEINWSRTAGFYFPIFAFAWAAAWVFISIWHATVEGSLKLKKIVLLLLFTAFLFTQALVRSDPSHLLPLYFPSFILFLFAWEMQRESRKMPSLALQTVGLFMLIPMFALPFKAKLRWVAQLQTGIATPLEAAADQRDAVAYVQARTTASERILVSVPRFDLPCRADVVFYFLARRQSITAFHELHPGVIDRPSIQAAVIARLETSLTRYIVRTDPFGESIPLSRQPQTAGSRALQDYIAAHYELSQTFGRYEILERKH